MNIFVARLNYRTNEDSLQKLFENYGEVSSAKIIFDRIEGRSKGLYFNCAKYKFVSQYLSWLF